MIDWLPAFVLLEQYEGDWERYIEAVYQYFKTDFIDSKPQFEDRRVGLKRYPLYQQKESAFWHCTSEGEEEQERIPDIRRCERIRWPRPIIEHSNDKAVRCWHNKRGAEKRILLWFYKKDYLVVLADRDTYVILWTAYPVIYQHAREKLMKEYEEYKNG
ncbi:MAG: hypothetical protein PHE15_06595 [Dehalococcoidales bacterium]|nr:hypothetical protein [Dehalococcoidales bacterium]